MVNSSFIAYQGYILLQKEWSILAARYYLRTISEDYSKAYQRVKREGKKPTTIAKEMNLDKGKLLRIIKNGIIEVNNILLENNDAYKHYENAIEYYLEKRCSLEEINREFGIKDSIFKRNIKEIFGIEPLDNRISFNRNIFHNIDTKEKAYWLGFILADGGIYKNELRIKLGEKDLNHLHKFCDFVGLDYSFIKKEVHSTTKNNLYKVVLSSNEIVLDLNEKGIIQNKTTKEEPFYNINEELLSDYIRGIIDGDGYIRKDYISIGLVGSQKLLTFVQDVFKQYLDIEPNKLMKHEKIFRIAYYRKEHLEKILEYLYKDSKIYLDRKYNLAMKFLPS
ncbi:hypothetical protein Goe21_00560 [Bacillus phage vB_BsuM-Goe21]|nr:hypothetical protein Goe21_00560 [Bacillus phage vB_BsuM-Goe21]